MRLGQKSRSLRPSISLPGTLDYTIIMTLSLLNFYASDDQSITLLTFCQNHLYLIILPRFPSPSTLIITLRQNSDMALLLVLSFIILCLTHSSVPLCTVPKRGSTKRRVVMDLSFPPSCSVNSGIPDDSYLDEHYKLRLPGIDRLCQFILQHGRGCLLYKLDLQRAYRQLPIDPKDYFYLGFRHNMLYFDTRCPFGLRTSTMICQRTTKVVLYWFTKSVFSLMFILMIFTAQMFQPGLHRLSRG